MCLKDDKKKKSKKRRKPGAFECDKCGAITKKKSKLCRPRKIKK